MQELITYIIISVALLKTVFSFYRFFVKQKVKACTSCSASCHLPINKSNQIDIQLVNN